MIATNIGGRKSKANGRRHESWGQKIEGEWTVDVSDVMYGVTSFEHVVSVVIQFVSPKP